MTEPLLWKCHVCGRERPDDKISVHIVDMSEEKGFPSGTLHQNVRFCNDDVDCIEKVRSTRLV